MDTIEIAGGFLVPATDTRIGAWAKQTGRLDHDTWLQSKLDPILKSGMTIVDGGAYVGDHTIYYSRKVGPSGSVHAFEPCQDIFDLLQKNTYKFPSQNVTIHPCGLAHRKMRVRAVMDFENHGATHFIPDEHGHETLVSLDQLLYSNPKIPKIDFIKLDLEGWEFYALIGADEIIKRDHPILMIEMNELTYKNTASSVWLVKDYLISRGYTFEPLQENLPANPPQYDLICFPTGYEAVPFH